MIHAYDETYLDDAMSNLGEAFDYAACWCGLTLDAFMEFFVSSGIAKMFANGNPKFVAGMSGTELVMEAMRKVGLSRDFHSPQISYDYSPEYWCGWILAYYQWYAALSFEDIHQSLSMEEIYKLYPILHEASEEKCVDTFNNILSNKRKQTKLQKQRKICGYSQNTLAQKADVNLRTLQQYELGAKDINKASVSAVIRLARVLGCKVEDLLEPKIETKEKNNI